VEYPVGQVYAEHAWLTEGVDVSAQVSPENPTAQAHVWPGPEALAVHAPPFRQGFGVQDVFITSRVGEQHSVSVQGSAAHVILPGIVFRIFPGDLQVKSAHVTVSGLQHVSLSVRAQVEPEHNVAVESAVYPVGQVYSEHASLSSSLSSSSLSPPIHPFW